MENIISNLTPFFWFTNGLMLLLGIVTWFALWLRSKSTGSDQLRSYIPTMWTSWGIFFTFVSIVFSLWEYADDASKLDIAVVIRNIIPAFTTSIIGIFFAIISTLSNRWSIANKEQEEANAFEKSRKEKDIASNTPELMLLEIVNAIRRSGNETCSTFKGSSKSNSDAITGSLNDGFKNAGKEMTTALNTQQRTFSDAVQSLSSAFTESLKTLKEELSSEMKELRSLLKDQIEQIEKQNNSLITTLIKQEGDLLDVVKKQLVEESERRNTELKSFISTEDERIKTQIDTANDAFVALYTRFEECIAGHVQKETDLFQNEIRQTIESFAQAQHQICADTIAECNAKLVENANASIASQTEVNKEFIEQLQSQLNSTCENLVSSISTMSEDMRAEIQSIHEKEVELIGLTINGNKQNVQLLLDANKESIASIAAEIKKDDEDIKQVLIDSQQKMKDETLRIEYAFHNELIEACDNAQSQINEIQNTIREIGNQIGSSLDGLGNIVVANNRDYIENIDKLKQQVVESCGDLLQKLTDKIDQSSRIDKLKTVSEDIATSITICMDNFKSRMSDIISQLNLTATAVRDSAKQYDEAAKKSDAINKYIEGTSDLFKLHSNSMNKMQSSLKEMTASVERLREQLFEILSQMKKTEDNFKSTKQTKK